MKNAIMGQIRMLTGVLAFAGVVLSIAKYIGYMADLSWALVTAPIYAPFTLGILVAVAMFKNENKVREIKVETKTKKATK